MYEPLNNIIEISNDTKYLSIMLLDECLVNKEMTCNFNS